MAKIRRGAWRRLGRVDDDGKICVPFLRESVVIGDSSIACTIAGIREDENPAARSSQPRDWFPSPSDDARFKQPMKLSYP